MDNFVAQTGWGGRWIGATVAAVLTISLCVTPTTTARAQDVDNSPEFHKLSAQALQSVVLNRTIVPGVGLSSASIGFEFSAVERGLGKPEETQTHGIIKKTLEWRYVMDDGTHLVVSGRQRVDQVNLIGHATSAFMTSEGVTFGMNAARVASVYGPSGEVDDDTLTYNQLGIAFRFQENQLAEIKVSQPNS